MVEFALLLPIFFALVFSIIEIGRAWAVKQALTISAREGARVLVLPYGAGLIFTSESDVQQAAVARVNSYLNSAGVPTGSGTGGNKKTAEQNAASHALAYLQQRDAGSTAI